jgi:hypothetical protein
VLLFPLPQKMKQSLFQAENKVRALQAQLAETYSDRMLLDTEKKVRKSDCHPHWRCCSGICACLAQRLRGIVENQAESIRSMVWIACFPAVSSLLIGLSYCAGGVVYRSARVLPLIAGGS